MKKITKVVIPVAGKGTRFLPITKTISKTLLPIIDKPVIQYLIEEAINAKIEEALIIIGPNQKDVIDYFDTNSEYVKNLNGKVYKEIEEIKNIEQKIKISYVVQESAKGLGDAVYYAKDFAKGEDFALILGDDFVYQNGEPVYGIGSLCKNYEEDPCYYLGVNEVLYDKTYKYGIVSPKEKVSEYFEINGIIEKPKDNPPSNMACVGRYILTNDIFDCIAKTKVGVGGEIQLTDAIAMALENRKIVASTFKGIRFDVGSKQGFVDAIKKIAEDRSDLN